MALTDKLTAIANAIRAKTGKTDAMTLDAMATEIESMSGSNTINQANIPDYIKTAVLDVANKVESVRKSDSIVFMAMSDSHHVGTQSNGWGPLMNKSNLHACMAAKILSYALKVDFNCHLGDFSFGHSTTTSADLRQQVGEFASYLDEAYDGIPQFRCVGNHDTGQYNTAENGSVNTALIGKEYLFDAIGKYCEGATYGSTEFGYCYRDFADKKLRVICLNSSEGETLNGSATSYAMSPAQLKWFAQTLYDVGSKSDASSWSVIVLSHFPLDFYAYNMHNAAAIVKSYVEGASTTQNGTTINFRGHNGAKFVAGFHGHVHCFSTSKLYSITNNAGTEFDAWRVAVPNSGHYRQNQYADVTTYGINWGETTTYDKVADTYQDCAFVINVINPSECQIHSFCYGAGYDRMIDYNAIKITSYTNQIPISTDTDGSIYNSTGYMYKKYINSSGVEGDNNISYLTGFIPVKVDDVIRMRNVEFNKNGYNGLTAGNQRIAVYDKDKNFLKIVNAGATYGFNPVYDDDGTWLEFTLASSVYGTDISPNIAYMRLNCAYIGEDSIITVNEVIDDPSDEDYINNLVRQATTPVTAGNTLSTEIYNDGLGYKNGTRISGLSDSANADYVATGMIPWAKKSDGTFPVLYIKGATLDTSKSYVRCTIVQTQTATNLAIQMHKTAEDASGWSAIFDIETLGTDYYKLTAKSDAGLSQYTCAFRMSLWGTGDNLIITADESIDDSGDTTTYTNQIAISTDTDGSIYNGKGYKEDSYLSSGNVGTKTGYAATGFIPVKPGDVLRFKNVGFLTSDDYSRLCCYKEDHTGISTTKGTNIMSGWGDSYVTLDDANNEVVQIKIPLTTNYTSTAFIRLCTASLGADSIITVNEEIV